MEGIKATSPDLRRTMGIRDDDRISRIGAMRRIGDETNASVVREHSKRRPELTAQIIVEVHLRIAQNEAFRAHDGTAHDAVN